jgi:predicted  nucleic acid-binding Zn-ribbon protein
MPRKVSVVADLDAARYIAAAKGMEKATSAADHEIDQMDRSIEAVEREMAEMAAASTVAARGVDDLGDKARGTSADLRILDARIEASKKRVRELGLEFARTGEAIDATAVGKERGLLGKLEKLRKELGDLAEVPTVAASAAIGSAAPSVAKGAAGAIGGIGGVPTPVIVGLVAAATLAGPAIGAIIGGAIAGAAGTGAMALGLVSAAKDTRVRAAAKQFGESVSGQFFAEGQAFVEPAIKGLAILERAIDDFDLGESLAKAAPTVEIMAKGIADFLEAFKPGFDKTLDRIGPFAEVAAEGIGEMGEAFGFFLDEVSGSKGALDGLRTFFLLLNGTIRFVGAEIRFLEDAFASLLYTASLFTELGSHTGFKDLDDGIRRMTGNSGQLQGQIVQMGTAAALASQGLDPFAGYLKEAADNADELDDSLMDLFNHVLGLSNATIGYEQSLDDLSESIKENGKTLDIHTEKGRNNQRALNDAISEAIRVRDELAKTQGIDAANRKFNEMLGEIQKIAANAGISKKALDEMVAKVYTVSIVTQYSTKGSRPTFNNQSFAAGEVRAEGGPLEFNKPYLFGEKGPEIGMFGPRGGHMFSTADSRNMARAWAGGSGGGGNRTITVIVKDTSGRTLRRELIDDALGRGQLNSVVAAAYP